MPPEKLEQSRVNKDARKERHERLKLISPLLRDWQHMEAALSPQEKHLQQKFLWRVSVMGSVFFLVLSLFPQFVSTAEDFWAPPEGGDIPIGSADSGLGIDDEGFMLKPEVITDEDDRAGLTDVREYTVQTGDTLSGIAAKHGVSTATILQNNDIPNPNALKPGQVLKIIPVNGLLHIVAKGDTLDSLAKKYAIPKDRIIAQNNFSASEVLQAGEQVIIPGAKKALPPAVISRSGGKIPIPGGSGGSAAKGKLLKPANGVYTQFFHYGHWAVDIAGKFGSAIYAAAGGTVEVASYGWNGGYGNYIIINHGNGLKTLYGHNSELYVSVGAQVTQGQVIAAMGKSGHVYGKTGVHSHFEVRANGVKQNPLAYF